MPLVLTLFIPKDYIILPQNNNKCSCRVTLRFLFKGSPNPENYHRDGVNKKITFLGDMSPQLSLPPPSPISPEKKISKRGVPQEVKQNSRQQCQWCKGERIPRSILIILYEYLYKKKHRILPPLLLGGFRDNLSFYRLIIYLELSLHKWIYGKVCLGESYKMVKSNSFDRS